MHSPQGEARMLHETSVDCSCKGEEAPTEGGVGEDASERARTEATSAV